MKPRFLTTLCLAALAFAVSAPAQPQPSPVERTRQARAQIDALLGPRRNAPAPPAEPANPLATPGVQTTPVDPASNNPTPTQASSDQELLARALKISGTATIGDRPQLIVNQQAYKEGDTIIVREGEQVMRVKLIRIAPPSAVFEVNGNEIILRIRG